MRKLYLKMAKSVLMNAKASKIKKMSIRNHFLIKFSIFTPSHGNKVHLTQNSNKKQLN